jgi:hypothetical protein
LVVSVLLVAVVVVLVEVAVEAQEEEEEEEEEEQEEVSGSEERRRCTQSQLLTHARESAPSVDHFVALYHAMRGHRQVIKAVHQLWVSSQRVLDHAS